VLLHQCTGGGLAGDERLNHSGTLIAAAAAAQFYRAQRVAQGHGQVALPAFKTDAANSAAFGVVQKIGLAPGPQGEQMSWQSSQP
jgi:hypothetical protein